MKPVEFFARHPVFRLDEFVAAHSAEGRRSRHTSATVLKQHVAAGNLIRIRRGLYATVPRGTSPEAAQVDPYLVAGRLTTDALISHHTALQLHGVAHSLSRRFTYLTRGRRRPFEFRGAEFVAVLVPAALRELPDAGGGIAEHRRQGLPVRVTTLERTLVDVLDTPQHGGGWEEIWRSLESVEFFDLDAVIEYALKLRSAVTVARVGFFLEQHRDPLMVEERHLEVLQAHAPAQPRYLDRRRRETGKLLPQWNLVVPDRVLQRSWEEVA